MFRVFNMGIGLVLIVADYYAEAITRYLTTEVKLPAWIIGEVVEGDRDVVLGLTVVGSNAPRIRLQWPACRV